MPNNPNVLNEHAGLLRRGWIDSYDPQRDIIRVKLNNAPITSSNPPIDVPAPHTTFYNNGIFIGTYPDPGTPVVVGQGSGNQYYFVSYLAENLPLLPDLSDGELLIQTDQYTRISLDTDYNINIGSDANRIHINTGAGYVSSNIDAEYSFTNAARRINGVVKRDLAVNPNFAQNAKLENDNYDPFYYVIPFDPNSVPSNVITGTEKNPAFVEQRELTYEFEIDSEVNDDLSESALYSQAGNGGEPPITLNRRTSRADTLSLTLAQPNYLIETIKGTVVDIFGNILDLNRNRIPVGDDQNTINPNQSTDLVASFLAIKALERKSIAYHFELNARKDLTGLGGQIALPDITSSLDHARNRSRFFLDIDKEGQLKLNVPASSETGNIGLLARYENFCTVNNTPNELIFNADNLDVYLDSFASPAWTPIAGTPTFNVPTPGPGVTPGSIVINDSGGKGSPIDRIAGVHIQHGTAYHDILQTCYAHQTNSFLPPQTNFILPPINVANAAIPNGIPFLTNMVSTSIPISGTGARAGGRSGSMNFDGSLDINIGANTVDRQSIWMDTAGGLVYNIGRDVNGRSAMVGCNGDVFMQIGGWGVMGDLRFEPGGLNPQNNGFRSGTLDLRIFNSGNQVHMIRCDDNGLVIMTPGNLQIYASKDITFVSGGNMAFEGKSVTIQGRAVSDFPKVSI